MGGVWHKGASLFLAITGLALFTSCSKPHKSSEPSVSKELAALTGCQAPAGVSSSPKTIAEAVSLINALPKPVSVSCFVASLARPLKVTLTSNGVSAQPAVGTRSPRIFIVNDKLIMSIVPEGPGQDLVEFSYMVSATASIKAELEFPVVDAVSPQAPYERIRLGEGTTCMACHGSETKAPDIDYANAFISKAIQPQRSTLVSLGSFRSELDTCSSFLEPKRCEMLAALLEKGEVQSYDFPASMPYFF